MAVHFDTQKMLECIAGVQNKFILGGSNQEIFGVLLEQLLELTGAEYGFVGEVMNNETQPYLKTHAITNIAWNEETLNFYNSNIENGLEFYNLNSLFGQVMVTNQPVISNDPKNDPRACGIPMGHPPLKCFLGLPFFKDTELLGMVGIANVPSGFDESDIIELTPFTSTCAALIEGFRAKKRAERFQNLNAEMIRELDKKVERLDSFSYIVSHNLRSHSSNLKALFNIAEEEGAWREMIPKMKSVIDRLYTTIDDLTLINRKAAGDQVYEEYDLQDLLDSTLLILGKEMRGKAVLVSSDFSKCEKTILPKVIAESVFLNLLSNAIKYSDQKRFNRIEVTSIIEEERLNLVFKDEGVGIDLLKYGHKLFGLYQTFHKGFESQGLGLFIIKNQLEEIGASIHVESEVDKGSVFRVVFPLKGR